MYKSIWVILLVLLVSCTKGEGEGGNSSISGKVNLQQWNSTFTVMSYETTANDHDVYIVYGDDLSFSDKTSTDHEGDFEFKYLREGEYTVYVYSKVNSAEAVNGEAPDEKALVQAISLGKKEEKEVEVFTVLKN